MRPPFEDPKSLFNGLTAIIQDTRIRCRHQRRDTALAVTTIAFGDLPFNLRESSTSSLF